MKKILLYAAFVLFAANVFSQTTTDALRFSLLGLNGSSNYISKAGAIGALGGDLTSASYNPAGLGLFNRNEFSFSMGYYGAFTSSSINGIRLSDDRSNFNLGHLGMVLVAKPYTKEQLEKSSIKAVQFSFSLNRLNSFGNRTVFQRNDLNYSYISSIIDNGMSDSFMDDFYNSYVVDFDTINNAYTSVFQNGKFNQMRFFTEEGSLDELTLSLSTNVENLLYLGATLGIPFGSYHREGSFMEERLDDQGKITDRYEYNETKDLSAAGINLKIGAIIKPVNWFRLGVAIHTPTFYTIEDNLYSEVNYEYVSGTTWAPETYSLRTPFRFLGSIAFVLGDNTSKVAGSISADYEYADYSNMKYRLNGSIKTETDINRLLSDMYQAANTLRLGGELKVGPFALRGGFALMQNPYKPDVNDASAKTITAGVGYRHKNFFLDFAYAYTKGNSNFFEYENPSNDNTKVDLETIRHIGQITLGFKF
ncbi:MAG: hypothetical protein LBM25_04505 [Bacteroidales bacterium]|nr:hypothetical protein [Bacteroidales bacterium]